VNNVNITNTTVNVTKVTNVYNTVIVNKSTTINNVTYVNQRVNNGVTVVSHDTFVNARPVARNVMRVDQKEITSAPISHMAHAEPIRTSVIGAGRPVNARPPAAVINRPVVAVRTPPALPRPIETRQAQAGGHLDEQRVLVRPVGPTRPAPVNQEGRPQQGQDGFRPFTSPDGGNNNGGNNQVRQMPQTQPRTNEQQGNPATENRNAATENQNRNEQPSNRTAQQENQTEQAPQNRMRQPDRNFRGSQQETRGTPAETNPRVRPTPPVQERTPQQERQQEQKFNQWHEQRPASPPAQTRAPEPRQQPSRQPEQRQDKPKK
jgi:hypothetical protein